MKVLTKLLISTSFVGGLAFSNFAFAATAIEYGIISESPVRVKQITPVEVPADVRIAPKALPTEKVGTDASYSKGGNAVGEKDVSKGGYEKGFSGGK